jgi:hypothetical protein
MTARSDSFQAVDRLLASRRLGEPVFIRCFALARDSAADPLRQVAQLAAVIRGWFSVPLHHLHAVGAATEGQIAVTLQFENGANALVVFARCPDGAAGLDWLILGNHGAAYHEAASGEAAEHFSMPQDCPPEFLSAIQRSLDRGQPELLAGSHQP